MVREWVTEVGLRMCSAHRKGKGYATSDGTGRRGRRQKGKNMTGISDWDLGRPEVYRAVHTPKLSTPTIYISTPLYTSGSLHHPLPLQHYSQSPGCHLSSRHKQNRFHSPVNHRVELDGELPVKNKKDILPSLPTTLPSHLS